MFDPGYEKLVNPHRLLALINDKIHSFIKLLRNVGRFVGNRTMNPIIIGHKRIFAKILIVSGECYAMMTIIIILPYLSYICRLLNGEESTNNISGFRNNRVSASLGLPGRIVEQQRADQVWRPDFPA